MSEEQAFLRPSLTPQMAETLGRNLSHQVDNAALFEIGRAFVRALVTRLGELDVYRIDLHARSDAPAARAFWQAAGFDLASYRMRRYLG